MFRSRSCTSTSVMSGPSPARSAPATTGSRRQSVSCELFDAWPQFGQQISDKFVRQVSGMRVLVLAILHFAVSEDEIVAQCARATHFRQPWEVVNGKVEVGQHCSQPDPFILRDARFHHCFDPRMDIRGPDGDWGPWSPCSRSRHEP